MTDTNGVHSMQSKHYQDSNDQITPLDLELFKEKFLGHTQHAYNDLKSRIDAEKSHQNQTFYGKRIIQMCEEKLKLVEQDLIRDTQIYQKLQNDYSKQNNDDNKFDDNTTVSYSNDSYISSSTYNSLPHTDINNTNNNIKENVGETETINSNHPSSPINTTINTNNITPSNSTSPMKYNIGPNKSNNALRIPKRFQANCLNRVKHYFKNRNFETMQHPNWIFSIFSLKLLFGFIRQEIQINQQKIVPTDIIILCGKYYGEFQCEPNAVKIYGDTAWNISPYYGESNYFLINIKNFILSPPYYGENNYFSKTKKIYIECCWKQCALTIIKRLFTFHSSNCINNTCLLSSSIIYEIAYHIYDTETGSYGELRNSKDDGHFMLSVDYNNHNYKIKLFKCCCFHRVCIKRYPKQSGNNMKRAIVEQINNGIITEHNQVWKIKTNGNELMEIDPCTEYGISKCLRQDGKKHIILFIDEYETDVIKNAKEISMKEQETKEAQQIAEAIKVSHNDIDSNIVQQQQIGNNVINIVMNKGYTLEQTMMAYSVFEAQQNQISKQILIERMVDYIKNVEQSLMWSFQ